MLASARDGGLDPGGECRRHLGPGLRLPERRSTPTRVLTEAGFRHRLLDLRQRRVAPGGRRKDGDDARGLGERERRPRDDGAERVRRRLVLPSHRGAGTRHTLLERALGSSRAVASHPGETSDEAARLRRATRLPRTRTPVACRVSTRETSTRASSTPRRARIVSLREVGPEQTFAVDAESVLDEPSDDAIDAIEYEQWLRDYWEHPDLDFDVGHGGRRRRKGGRDLLRHRRRESRRAFNAYTGSLRAYRGRGLARLAKLGAMRRLAELGVDARADRERRDERAHARDQRSPGLQPIASRYAYVLDR